jgi:hypothetical protein
VLYEQAHKFILLNHPAMANWMERHAEVQERTSTVASFRHWVRGAILEAMDAGVFVSQIVLDISAGPNVKAYFYSGMLFKIRR